MKSLKEIEAELEDKANQKQANQKVAEKTAEEILEDLNSIKADFKAFKTDLKAFKPTFDVAHTFSEIESVKALKRALKTNIEELKNIHIPKEIEINNRIDFKNRTKKFLIWFFVFSILIIGTSLYFSFSNQTLLCDSSEKSRIRGVKQGIAHCLEVLKDVNHKTSIKKIKEATSPIYLQEK